MRGSIQILLGAAAIAAYGFWALGWRLTAIFFVVTYGLSLSIELAGTSTGWPFGPYAYTDFLGWKVLGHVPYTIPFSWFSMGLTSYILGTHLAAKLTVRRHALWSLLCGAWLLTAWDLVLDPAMAHPDLQIHFWRWGQDGVYFGMPLQNLVGWSVTGLAFMAASRVLWKRDLQPEQAPPQIPLIFYTMNMVFAMAVSAHVGLWLPVVLATLLGLIPATLAWAWQPRQRARRLRWAHDG
ncbi:MAG: hypothetical protein KatS3mg059_0602 [Thermomicrobiales bacterium]|nr:MAG: hypothetical protein KatS3mg059_0602 [Thermomicrobiales bacterium]